MNLLKIDENLHAPPVCDFEWAGNIFTGIIEKIDSKFTMFGKDGTPMRARLSLSFKEYSEEITKKNSPDRTKRLVTKEGDTLWLIATKAYGDPDAWKIIANANDIEDPRSVKPGTSIIIPPLD